MSLRFVRPFTVGAILLLLLIMTASPSVAASRQQPATKPPSPVMTFGHFTTVHVTANAVLPTSLGSGQAHYLYADDGTSPDSIDVWKIGTTLTHVGNYPDNANNDSGIYNATSRLAVAAMDKAHGACLLQADGENNTPPGFINSYPINSDGSLGSQVSHLQAQNTSAPTGDVHVSGDTAYLDNQGGDFESYSIGTGCVLAFEHSAPQTGTVVDFALVGKELFAPNCSGSFDIYKLGTGGTITFLKSTPSQASCPDGVAAGSVQTKTGKVTNVFSGQSIANPATVEGGQLNKKTGVVTYLTGSPASDSSGQLGLAGVYDSNDGLLISGEAFSSAVGVYTVKHGTPGTPGSISYMAHVALPNAGEPEVLVQFHATLFVLSLNGVINSCTLAKTGVSACAVAATVTSGSLPSGLAIL